MKVTINISPYIDVYGNINHVVGHIVQINELETVERTPGGFTFTTERTPSSVLKTIEDTGLTVDDFVSITLQRS